MSRILAVGIASLDIINSVNGYPAEDDEVRSISQRKSRGGNATNTLAVLSQLGHACYWAGVIADEPDADYILADLQHHQIDTRAVLRHNAGKVPTSYITHNLRNGTRTIIHYRELPEYPFSQFRQLDLNAYDWLHFEGRNVADTREMLAWAKQHAPSLPRSVEIEKERDDIESLFTLADVLLFSKSFARQRGYDDATSLLTALQPQCGQARLVCAWGEAGAWALEGNNELHSPAFPPAEIVDTLAAGDTFNAGIIDALAQNQTLAQALTSACQLAGRKCGHQGLDFLKDIHND